MSKLSNWKQVNKNKPYKEGLVIHCFCFFASIQTCGSFPAKQNLNVLSKSEKLQATS